MEKTCKSLVVRFPKLLHREIKVQAYKEGKTIQEWVFEILQKHLLKSQEKITWKNLCQQCGQWELKGTQMALMQNCERCGKKDTAVFPCSIKGCD